MKTIREQIVEMLLAGVSPKEIAETLGCDKTYPYQVRRRELNNDEIPKRRNRKMKPSHDYEGPAGLKQLLDEYGKACKTIDKVVNFLLEENSDLKEQVRQFNEITRDATRPTFSPKVQKAFVVFGD